MTIGQGPTSHRLMALVPTLLLVVRPHSDGWTWLGRMPRDTRVRPIIED